MSITINTTTAKAYFDSRIEADLWKAFQKSGLQDRALQSAQDVLDQRLAGGSDSIISSSGTTILDETVDEASQYYPDRAIYAQALYMLRNSDHTANGELTGQKWVGVAKDGKSRRSKEDVRLPTISDEAMRWMNWSRNPNISIARG